MQNFCLSEAIMERFKQVEDECGFSEHIVKLDCATIDTWEFRDRKTFEVGNIDDLALSIKHVGQCQPIIVVRPSASFKPKEDPNAEYVVIAGYRRWMACKKYNIEVQAIVRNLSFEQAITVLVSENEKETVSDYSKGFFYHTLLSSEKISAEQLCHRLNISLAVLNNYLAFAHVPEKIWVAVGDLSRVSAKTAAVILSLSKKGQLYEDALISIGEKIAHGFGEKRILEAVDIIIDRKLKRAPRQKIIDHKIKYNGKVIMTLHQGRFKLDKTLLTHPHYDDLVKKIEQQVTDFAQQHLT